MPSCRFALEVFQRLFDIAQVEQITPGLHGDALRTEPAAVDRVVTRGDGERAAEGTVVAHGVAGLDIDDRPRSARHRVACGRRGGGIAFGFNYLRPVLVRCLYAR